MIQPWTECLERVDVGAVLFTKSNFEHIYIRRPRPTWWGRSKGAGSFSRDSGWYRLAMIAYCVYMEKISGSFLNAQRSAA